MEHDERAPESRLKKRPRATAGDHRPLSQFMSGWTVCLKLSNSARTQSSILGRNLTRHGAILLDPGSLDSVYGSGNRTGLSQPFVIVTESEVYPNLGTTSSRQGRPEAVVVSKQWAIDSLREQRPLELEHFEIKIPVERENVCSGTLTKNLAAQSLVEIPHVCCFKRLAGLSQQDKSFIILSLPRWIVMRATYNSNVLELPNTALREQLRLVADKRRLTDFKEGDMKSLAYQKAAAAVSALPFKVERVEDIRALNGANTSISAAVDQFFIHGTIPELDDFSTNHQLKAMRELTGVYGISVSTARRLCEVGVRSIEDAHVIFARKEVVPSPGVLEALQHQIGLAHPVRIAEARNFVDRIETLANNLLDVNLRFKLCGGFRRGEKLGHDIDVLYCRRDSSRASVLHQLLALLKSEHLLVATLRVHANASGNQELSFKNMTKTKSRFPYSHDLLLTICRTDTNKPVRVDFVGVRDRVEFPFATLAWSGSTLFQRDLRAYAEKECGWIFNQHGLFNAETGERVALSPVPSSEHDVFHALRLAYRPPFERCA
jgi:DNA polymerase/3'-5' exonuclease PolX